MQKLTKIPENIKDQFKTAHQKALMAVLRGKKDSIIIPAHVVKMRIKMGDTEQVTDTIIPDIAVYISDDAGDIIYRDNIVYRVALNNTPFPMAHVYSSSGYLCLGSIFVPSQLPREAIMTPLETLFLHNDRIMHGNPQLPVTKEQRQELEEAVLYYFPQCPTDFNENFLREDTVWKLGNYVLENAENREIAVEIMQHFFRIIFTREDI